MSGQTVSRQKVVVTGATFFLNRLRFLFEEIAQQVDSVEYIKSQDKTALEQLDLLLNLLAYGLTYLTDNPEDFWKTRFEWRRVLDKFTITRRAFVTKSKRLERRIHEMSPPPDWIIQVFGLASPLWEQVDIPYAYYLDYTMALAKKVWSPWLPYNERECFAFLDCERRAFQKAAHLFPMSYAVKQSLIEDYGVDPSKITVVGSAGNFKTPYAGDKHFGSKRLIFNGSDFYRKGGDIVLEAFKLVKHQHPEAKLSIIGTDLEFLEDGVENPGFLGSAEALTQLFLSSDLALAPARCEPYGHFLVEAMNYGVPCIASNNGGMPEIVDHQLNGIVLAELSPKALAEEISHLLSAPQRLEALSNNARSKVANQLNWNRTASAIVNTMNQLNMADKSSD